MNKVLIITYYWPPAGGAGVQRILKFAKYLPEFGWEPIILTIDNPDSPINDESLLTDIPDNIKVIKTSSIQPYNLYRFFTGKKKGQHIPSDILIKNQSNLADKLSIWLRLNLFIPDAKIGWIPYAVKAGCEVIKNENIKIILSSSPPHTVQLIAGKIAAKTGVKWIADYRDPWLEMLHNQNAGRFFLSQKIDAHFEKKSLLYPDAITTISDGMVEIFRTKAENNYYVIPNGYDETDLLEVPLVKNDCFTIAYTGIMSVTRVPEMFLKSLKRLKTEQNAEIKLSFAGKVCKEFFDLLDRYDLQNNFEYLGYLEHKESTKVLMSADVLLLVVDNIPNNKGFLTGKIFEYLGCKKPVFAVGPADGNAAEIIKKSDSGIMADYNDEDGTYKFVLDFYNDWKTKKSRFSFKVEQFSRKQLTGQLKAILEKYI